LAASLTVRITIGVVPISAFHYSEIDFANIGKIIKESLRLFNGMAISEGESHASAGYMLGTADKINDVVLILDLPRDVAVNVREQHWGASTKVEWT
jgi:hypothetical protein